MTTTATRPEHNPSAAPSAPYEESWPIRCCERGWLPDWLIRAGMRTLIRQRLADEHADDGELSANAFEALVATLRASPIALHTQDANAQHYEVPAAFFAAHLGAHLKYSCGYYPRGDETLDQAQEGMLALYAQRAGIEDGQRILDLGCGWGALSLWLAERFPRAQIVGLSNSHGQRAFILQRAAERGLSNLRIVTGDVASFDFPAETPRFDRVLSIEMFEHMKHYGLLLAKIAGWLADDGELFVHHFAHRLLAYHFVPRDGSDWMARHFFTGGTMPSANLLLRFQDDLCVTQQWWLDGRHYERTANHWLAALDDARDQVLPLLAANGDARQALQRWRMFYMAVAELFGYARGQEWGVAHLRMRKRL
ncbi:cyclopropane-fatty-acyl-phospholipid synthase [Paraburkholderia bannensis]|uniref:Cyclopropane-fatty-acyl-phospholipid synthase n=1 Tax=Paraburkholderia bannensis TaxID=765414 RepID=A0A7W9U2W6_9BURK|nr:MULTISPECIES: class I SAM-dependent methyltransferase [Paraburkholderia]MBB3261014.1 cyclopropane-fatty-acyl-phospholipid synthase [Paraburkholderia sp. WP4_3_2]MBB6106051.1 cyclopropane-fatty-acyl-phospholipid synthase [Paraburkholderia bannensis]